MFEVEFEPFDFQPTNMVYVMGQQELVDNLCERFVQYIENSYDTPVPVEIFEAEMADWDIDYNLLSQYQKNVLDTIDVEP